MKMGWLTARTGRFLVDDNGQQFELLKCGHAGPRATKPNALQARCLACAANPDWKLRALGWRRDGAVAAREGMRRFAVEQLEAAGIDVPFRLTEPLHESALFPDGASDRMRTISKVGAIYLD